MLRAAAGLSNFFLLLSLSLAALQACSAAVINDLISYGSIKTYRLALTTRSPAVIALLGQAGEHDAMKICYRLPLLLLRISHSPPASTATCKQQSALPFAKLTVILKLHVYPNESSHDLQTLPPTARTRYLICKIKLTRRMMGLTGFALFPPCR